ncbi:MULTISPECIES: TIGR01621 family pseudouridine synthase [Shewanella]|jgi:tRNA pseudouridine32 synthase/23S rRNA pseudouridine746 synthase|uniref:TIGR01621 family pseudouridine synthase n=1 Tax=Shewanella putrefaciens TaxID=24 RepID=A0ABX8XCK9_SHEPU|nr:MULTISPECIES: TIGR01621 family pseudouridine synthase [Shewanella]ABM23104.1 pseudouridine synthase Rlu family protein, TIGR01621 [Shewanella sp. W3-18-1]MCA1898399.1 TIGR01621 family pseudouridine synthase [Shewanella putrefaciens]MCK7635209.1 TIGR01621 family pseudouridine synthase [Shewanella sp. JNE17]MCK7650455.1 TIGR01621 family pseudouridine synthase [Shewanella sp. JNE8]MCK7658632.1 TIGR01621 family pseudouridine synthase [Shewanella sp. JNE4-2]
MYQIIADEADFLVISKFPKVHFHSQDGTAGVVAQVEQDLGIKLFAVHRLDTPTSGLLILAKSTAAAKQFTELFTAHKVQKYYLALAKGKPKKKQGWVIGDMAKSRRSMFKLLRTKENPAITQFFSVSVGDGLRLYLLKPHSGKTHQLRVALASLGVPILGDELYGGAVADRCYLHAYCLHFRYQDAVTGWRDYTYLNISQQGEAFQLEAVSDALALWHKPETLAWPSKE